VASSCSPSHDACAGGHLHTLLRCLIIYLWYGGDAADENENENEAGWLECGGDDENGRCEIYVVYIFAYI